ncbi:30S ribosomal protein S6 [bacterium]|nr:30S ribosomal protein S6 [bacterium]
MAVKNNFEVVMIADAKLTDEESRGVFEKFKGIVKNQGGEVKFESGWGRRKLAYEIDKKRHGIYHLLYIEGNGELVDELERQFGYDDNIIKFFVIAVDDLEKAHTGFEALKSDPGKNAGLVKEAMGA